MKMILTLSLFIGLLFSCSQCCNTASTEYRILEGSFACEDYRTSEPKSLSTDLCSWLDTSVFSITDMNANIFTNGQLNVDNITDSFQYNTVNKTEKIYQINYAFTKASYLGNADISLNFYQSSVPQYVHNKSMHAEDNIIINGQQFIFDSIMIHTNGFKWCEHLSSTFGSGYFMSVQKEQYYAISLIQNADHPSADDDQYLFLFDVSATGNVKAFFLGRTKCLNSKCFGTYSKSDHLNYLRIQLNKNGSDTLFVYELKNDRFKKVDNKYLTLNCLDGNNYIYKIDCDNSKW